MNMAIIIILVDTLLIIYLFAMLLKACIDRDDYAEKFVKEQEEKTYWKILFNTFYKNKPKN